MKNRHTTFRAGLLASLLVFSIAPTFGSGAYTPLPPRPPGREDASMSDGMPDKKMPGDRMMKMLVNADASGVALAGHDPVAFFSEHKAVPGRAEFSVNHGGATYRFASADNAAKFRADPARYVPQFGGFCAYGVSVGKLLPVEVNAFAIVNGRLLMQSNAEVRDRFKADEQGNLKKADANWPGLVKMKGK